jgi:thiamine biosynthesis lipoprotein
MIGRLHHLAFRAMGTTCTVSVTATPADRRWAGRALAAGRAEVEACERALSRFDPASDLSRLNGAAGAWIEVDPRLVSALRTALGVRRSTGGRFDPAILPALVAAGYDRSFEELSERPARAVPAFRAAAAIELERGPARARVEAGAAVDLGGIGKGFSAARALDALRCEWPDAPGAVVDLGGDLAVWGLPPDRGPWRIAIADPRRAGSMLGTLELGQGGVSTSGRNTRRFGPGRALHHLIDPATGTPADAGPLAVTVVAGDPAEAEGYATALAISTADEARRLLAGRGDLSALYVPAGGPPLAFGPLPLQRAAVAGAAA